MPDTSATQNAASWVLVVHGDAEKAQRIAAHFQACGHQVDTAACCGDGEALLQTCRYDILIATLDLPDGSGLDLLPLCPRWFGGRAVLLGDSTLRAEALAAGALAVLDPDTDPRMLQASVDCAIAQAMRSSDADAPSRHPDRLPQPPV
jgi:DNA-binding response OmpR family regulator